MCCYLKDCVEKILRGFAVDPIPDILGGQVVLGQYLFWEQEPIIPQRVWNSTDVFANADLHSLSLTACPR
jgi:hypothetical protein